MKIDRYATLEPHVADNEALREPQRLAYEEIVSHDFSAPDGREVGIVLPVGCGKSGLLALAPFAVASKRTLLVAPNLNIADQLNSDLTPSNPKYFYLKRKVLSGSEFPEPAEIRGTATNFTDLVDADIVITNIQQLQRDGNTWLAQFEEDFFDLILFDEAHHNVADSWEGLRAKFPAAKIINVSATPTRADGRKMTGNIIYSYPISEAVKNGFVKRVNGRRLNPGTLTYVRRDGEQETLVGLDEVRQRGEVDADFRRSIVSSKESLVTIVSASIRKLERHREATGEKRLKIIASALNMEHCIQIVTEYRARGLRADYVHSKQEGPVNKRVYQKLDNHELDVIVQVRKLGEGFDHPYLSVAAVFSIFANLGPFVQFIGRIMRVIPDVEPSDPVNDGFVVFHVGGNITGVWHDFAAFAEADQEYFANLIDEDLVESAGGGSDGSRPRLIDDSPDPVVTAQSGVTLEDIALLQVSTEVADALRVLAQNGVTTGREFDELVTVPPTKQAMRQAKRKKLDDLIKLQVGRILGARELSPQGRKLDKTKRGKTNFEVLKGAIDVAVNSRVPSGAVKRKDFTSDDLDYLIENLPAISDGIEEELLRG
ncbi:DEAD/DEAH box helicase [Amycolatopsis sp. NPDC088138]|uniref:DEAD/DEAH box helicase n=1 Tax=Amycolatopsis sp. NPDC088138 TaxID=3363938 RepID=UPI00380760C1